MDEKEMTDWAREQFQRANKHLAEIGILFDAVTPEESKYLAPVVAVWKIRSTEGKRYWVISGDVPADVIAESAAATARDALRYFAYQWQMKASNLMAEADNDQTKNHYAALLEKKGVMLYDISTNDELWQSV
ncbi:DUF4826 family protein [Alteromonas sediminis]|uniref:DUF4826 family protein n=1 Tax=Alteromonas sediminis TaxID=2259342 RepID=A0A3N5Y3S1_9ALTE|nr:DUF4826 family protein [Alteromonas sediminis]RPJ68727.1 DUF4826 family protein [Alteromonas sediminis]